MKIFESKVYLGIEFILLFFGVPVYVLLNTNIIHPSRLLLPIIIIIFIYLTAFTRFTFKKLIRFNISGKMIWRNVFIFFLVSGILVLYVYIFEPSNLFNLPTENTRIWMLLFLLYPIFSASLQEIIYRTFLFRRYEKLFQKPLFLVIASGITFGFAHILYYHPLSIFLTIILGIYLGYLYHKTRSVLFTSIIHGLYGNLVFTIGLGQYFWLDMHKYL